MIKQQLALLILILNSFHLLIAQTEQNPLSSLVLARKISSERNIFHGPEFENIGPTVFSGRVSDLCVDPTDPTHFYVAYASGGLWETNNNGTTFNPLFDHEASMTIGAIACDWKNKTLWVGTGEVNSSRSSYAGTGIYKSKDNGINWEHMGLPESHHIGKVLLNPDHPDVVTVAVLGHLYTDNHDRGVYRTKDGGKTWEQVLYINDSTGIVDLISDPVNPNILYAAAWERSRKAWNFKESGHSSGIYKSMDGGDTWEKLSDKRSSGFPHNEGVGRIGLSMYNDGKNSRLYAILDNYNRRPEEDKGKSEELKKRDFEQMDSITFSDLDEGKLEKFLRSNDFPEEYSASSVKKLHAQGKIKSADLKTYLEDANSLLFDTPVIGAEVYVSDDDGRHWKKTHDFYLDQVYNSYGYYFGLIKVSPSDPDEIYIGGVPVLKSKDGGKTWKNINGDNVHGDHHALWIDPKRKGHLILGNDGGINISYDSGENWIKCNAPAVGQFYYVNVDHEKPYNVYGGTQDNGVWKGSHRYRPGKSWQNFGKYPYEMIMGGDGMQVMVDTRNNNTVYTGFQFGNYFRLDLKESDNKYITPKHSLGDRPFRWNWQSPIHLSIHNQDVLYMGSNFVHRSLDRGDHFDQISPDLTKGGRKGDVTFGTLSCLHESPIQFGLLYAGSDDGLVHVSKDGGYSWQNISNGLPTELWVSRVQASGSKISRVYVSLNGYRNDDFKSYLFRSEDFGEHWIRIGTDLPQESVNVVKEDPTNENVIYAGTDGGVYVSLDMGDTFMRLSNGLPNVPVHDLVIHPTASDLIVGTHGRSIYKLDVSAIQAFNDEIESSSLYVFGDLKIRHSASWGNKRNLYSETRKPVINIQVYAKEKGSVLYQILNEDEIQLAEGSFAIEKGVQKIPLDLNIDEKGMKALKKFNKNDPEKELPSEKDDGLYYLPAGNYTIYFSKADAIVKKALTIDK